MDVTSEILDLVDENDVIIGEVERRIANADPTKLHREIGVILVDNKKRVLLQRRSLKKKIHPGLWILSAAGHVPQGMDPMKAAYKELLEELGFDTKLTFVEKFLNTYEHERNFAYLYSGQYKGENIILDPSESEAVILVNRSEIVSLQKQELIEPVSAKYSLRLLDSLS